jgi:hypothetical protein
MAGREYHIAGIGMPGSCDFTAAKPATPPSRHAGHWSVFHPCRASSKVAQGAVFRRQLLHSNQNTVVPAPTCTLAAGGVPQTEQGLIGLLGTRDSGQSLDIRAPRWDTSSHESDDL